MMNILKPNPKILEPLTKQEFLNTYDFGKILSKDRRATLSSRYDDYCKNIYESLHRVIKKKDVNAAYMIGNYIADGRIKIVNPNLNRTEVAIGWMLPAVEDGNLLAAYRVGQLYLDLKDTITAASYFRKCYFKLDKEELEELGWPHELERFHEIDNMLSKK